MEINESMKTTKKEFEIFKAECERLIELFGLKEWNVAYEHIKLKCNGNATYKNNEKIVTFSMTTHTNDLWKGPKYVARHEIGHILVADLACLADIYIAEIIVTKHDETFANRFANAIEIMED